MAPKLWTREEVIKLKELVKQNLEWNEIGSLLGRSRKSVTEKFYKLVDKKNATMPVPKEPNKAADNYGIPKSKVQGLQDIESIKNWYKEKVDSIRSKCNFKSDFEFNLSKTHPYIIVKIPDMDFNKIKLVPLGDFHYGVSQCSVEKLKEWIEWVRKTKNAFVVLMGDTTENSTRYSVGSGVYEQILRPRQQKIDMMEILAPIRHKIIAMVEGNHGRRSVQEVDYSPEQEIANTLEIPFFRHTAYIDIVWGGHLFEIFATHGTTGAVTEGGKINAIAKPTMFTRADIFLQGHTHDKFAKSKLEFIRDRKTLEIQRRKYYLVNTGSFMNYWDSYAEGKLYGPVPIGTVNVELYKNGDYHCTS